MALFRICAREWFNMLINSGDRSRARSGVTMWAIPFNVTATSAGVELKS